MTRTNADSETAGQDSGQDAGAGPRKNWCGFDVKPSQDTTEKTYDHPKEAKIKVKVKSYWWGYEVYFDRESFEFLEASATVAAKAIAETVEPPLGEIIAAYIESRVGLAKAEKIVFGGTGVYFTSFWPVPGLLFPLPWNEGGGESTAPEDNVLWWTLWQEGRGWSKNRPLSKHYSQKAPALAADGKGSFFCVHQPLGTEGLGITTYSCEDGSWHRDERLPATVRTFTPPAAAWHPQFGLVVAYVDENFTIQWTRRPAGPGASGQWTDPQPICDPIAEITAMSTHAPGLAVHGGSLVCAYTSTEDQERQVYVARMFPGDEPSSVWKIEAGNNQQHSDTGVSLTSDGQSLLCATVVDKRLALWSKKSDDDAWEMVTSPDVAVGGTPSVAYVTSASPDPSCVCLYRKPDNDELGMVVSNKGQIPDLTFTAPKNDSPRHHTTTDPAVVYSTYKTADGSCVNQAMCIHHGRFG
ncbi:hypothetical protein Actkin_02184 [Actinokineospora sp. UTMC 2448]|nr:hypothetical protein Actkin_02184 [Actinokineospora sp. UTMC 2448]